MSNSRGTRPSRQLVDAPEGDDPRMQVSITLADWITERRAGMGDCDVNAYKCPACGLLTVTWDRHAGVTPMFLTCRRTEGCKGQGVSSGYPAPPRPASVPEPAWEWYRPSATEVQRLERDAKDRNPLTGSATELSYTAMSVLQHINNGGLLLRELQPAVRAVSPEE